MKMVRSLLLGSAAGLVAVAGAQAADLPLKAKPVEYVKVCSVYGAGFYYVPGTDTCIKVGGYVRLDIGFNAGGSHAPYVSGTGGQDTRQSNSYETRVRGIVSWDARTQTEYGTLRAYINAGWELNSGDANYRGTLFFFRSFIQFAGLTIGKTQSFFGFYNNALNFTTHQGGGQSDAGLNLLAYTMQFGGGFSATISLEDGMHHRGGLWDTTLAATTANTVTLLPGVAAGIGSYPAVGPQAAQGLTVGGLPGGGAPFYGDYGGNRIPDIVGNLRVDQPWGSVQIAGAFHEVNAAYAGSNTAAGSPSGGRASGWAASAGAKFNLPWAQGDEFWVQGTWARGATNYLGLNPFVHSGGQFARYDGSRAGADRSVGLAWTLDGVFDATGISLTEGWSVLAAIQHYWTPSLRTSVFGHYTSLDYGAAATAKFCAAAGATPTTTATFAPGAAGGVSTTANNIGGAAAITPGAACNPDFAVYQIGSRTIWSPVRNIDIGVEVLYTRLDQNFTSWTLGSVGSRPSGVYAAADQDIWSGTVRFQRNFWP